MRTDDARRLGLASLILVTACEGRGVGDGGGGTGGTSTHIANATGSTKASASTGGSPATTRGSSAYTVISASTYGSGPTACEMLSDCEACLECAGELICSFEVAACLTLDACAALNACISGCPVDDPLTPDDERLLCVCGVASGSCPSQAPAGTCMGDHPEGVPAFVDARACLDRACAPACS